jgi:hypothetical protein
MTRVFPILAAAATVALLAFGAGDASAMNLGSRGGDHPGGGPSGPTGSPSHVDPYVLHGCDADVDLSQLVGGAQRDYLQRCGQPRREF